MLRVVESTVCAMNSTACDDGGIFRHVTRHVNNNYDDDNDSIPPIETTLELMKWSL